MCRQYLLFVYFLSFIICFAESVPPSILSKTCKAADSKCIKETAKAAIPEFVKGIPELNVPVLDPLHMSTINASQGNLLFVLTDITAVGLRNCDPKKIERDVVNSKIHIKILCSGQLDGQYELQGNLLLFPVEGKGGIHVNLKSALVSITLDMADKDGSDGKKHWNIKSWTHSFELKDKSEVVFENLYSGNEVLARAARELVENNGNDIIMEIGPEVVKALVAKVVKCINSFFKAIPYEDLSLD